MFTLKYNYYNKNKKFKGTIRNHIKLNNLKIRKSYQIILFISLYIAIYYFMGSFKN
jgi:hypothetical protein